MKGFFIEQLRSLSRAKREFNLLIWPTPEFFTKTMLWVLMILITMGVVTNFVLDPVVEWSVLYMKSKL